MKNKKIICSVVFTYLKLQTTWKKACKKLLRAKKLQFLAKTLKMVKIGINFHASIEAYIITLKLIFQADAHMLSET